MTCWGRQRSRPSRAGRGRRSAQVQETGEQDACGGDREQGPHGAGHGGQIPGDGSRRAEAVALEDQDRGHERAEEDRHQDVEQVLAGGDPAQVAPAVALDEEVADRDREVAAEQEEQRGEPRAVEAQVRNGQEGQRVGRTAQRMEDELSAGAGVPAQARGR
jgi:hypothetical protein